jgi:hypothetical protein
MTSAGVRMAQDTSSARLDADAWTTATGKMVLPVPSFFVFNRVNKDFVCSYVVKNAPAGKKAALDMYRQEGGGGRVTYN